MVPFRVILPLLVFVAGLHLAAHPPPATLQGQDFVRDPKLHGGLRQTSILDLSPETVDEPIARYQLEGGKYTFCLDQDDPYLEGITVESTAGRLAARVSRPNRCQKAFLTTGAYRIRLHRDLGAVSNAGHKIAFVHADLPVVPLVNDGGVPAAGWWAMRASPEINLNGQPGYPRMHADILTIPSLSGNYQGRPWMIDFSGKPPDAESFLSFSDGGSAYTSPRSMRNDSMNSTEEFDLNGNVFTVPFMDDDNSYFYSTFEIGNRGNYRFQMNVGSSNSSLAMSGDRFDTYGILLQAAGGPLTPISYFEVLFRYLPVGSFATNLYAGEVALAQNCQPGNGQSGVFATDQPDLASVSGSVMNFVNTTQYVQAGNDTAVTLYSGPNYTGTATLVKNNACLPGPPTTRSFKIQPLSPVITVGSRSCVRCLLEGVDLSGQDLSGVDFTGANFTGATLTNTNLSGATLIHATLSGATLHCTSLNGSGPTHLVDLTTAVLKNLKLVPDSACQINMSDTHLALSSFPATLWKFVDLSNSVIDGVANQQLSTKSKPLDLTKAVLTGVSLEGVGLDYAILSGANLINAVLNGATLREASAEGVLLNGANLSGANLDHADLQGALLNPDPAAGALSANLSSAFLRNVNLANAQLSGADLTAANFYSTAPVNNLTCAVSNGVTQQCATASGATMNSTIFEDALLAGVDFTNSNVQGVRFGNAILAGANFLGAKISVDSKLGTDSGFTGAYLQGANLQPAATIDGTSFLNAFLDFGAQQQVGNTMYFSLNGSHTSFAGYWNAGGKGKNACVEISYTQATTVPQQNTTITCPDGSAGTTTPLGCGVPSMVAANAPHWASGVDIGSSSAPASYQFNSTYTPAAVQPICTPDPTWGAAGNSQLK